MSASRPANADRGSTSSAPACRAASIRSTCTCEAKPIVRVEVDVRIRLERGDCVDRIGLGAVQVEDHQAPDECCVPASRISSGVRANWTSAPTCFAVARIFELKRRSSTAARMDIWRSYYALAPQWLLTIERSDAAE